MPRMARAVAMGFPHHITQRGNYRQPVFSGDGDRFRYLDWLREYSERHALKVWAYCLMENHVHFVAVPSTEDSMSKTFKTLHMRYSRYINEKKNTSGHLWQGRFYSCALDERHLHAAVRYVENNPVRAGIVKRAEDYGWSSARAHVNGEPDAVLSHDCPIAEGISDWSAYLREAEEEGLIEALRGSTKTGRPCGSASFVSKIEEIIGRRLRTSRGGRPRKRG